MGDEDNQGPGRRDYLRSLGLLGIGVSAAGCNSEEGSTTATTTSTATTSSNTPTTAGTPSDSPAIEFRLKDNRFEKREDEAWKTLLVRGVNLGASKPGHFPGETPISRSEYDRWIRQIGNMEANVIRVYTIHPPAFYRALEAYNADADSPVYLLHGAWFPERFIAGQSTAFDEGVATAFDAEIERVVDVVHGNTTLPERDGHASGEYTADVSEYTLGYIPGIEWPPQFVWRTNQEKQENTQTTQFIKTTSEATAFEEWLARRLDNLVHYEISEYEGQRPISFVNWPTTDHLEHPVEPLVWEDKEAVNPNAFRATPDFESGLFSTFHVYPYYPDFINLSQEYASYTDASGVRNNFAGYLNDLISTTNHPVLIGEYGVPSSRGIAHHNVHGMDQGHNTEQQQGEFDARQFKAVVDEGALGGIVFSWHDEWFKRTWNSRDYAVPGRRPKWLNVQSPEQRFGLLAFEPSAGITLSGKPSEWAETTVLYAVESEVLNPVSDGYDSGRSLTEMRAAADEAFLYLRLEYANFGAAVDWEKMATVVGIDMTPDRGNTNLPANLGLGVEDGLDFIVELRGPERSRVRVASHYDRFYYEYGHERSWLQQAEYASKADNGVYHPIRQATSHPLEIPTQDRTIPFEFFETGQLRFGVADPASPAFDSLTDVHVSSDENTIEVRLPWQLLNFRDPSSRTIAGDFWTGGIGVQERIEDLGLVTVTYRPDTDEGATEIGGLTNVTDSLPRVGNGDVPSEEIPRFSWETWNRPAYTERTKRSYDRLREVYGQLAE